MKRHSLDVNYENFITVGMVDLAFMLIFFFMCVSTMGTTHFENLTLPEMTHSENVDHTSERLIINIATAPLSNQTRVSRIFVDHRAVNLPELAEVLHSYAERTGYDQQDYANGAVIIRVDRATKYADLQTVLQVCRQNRFWKIAYAVTSTIGGKIADSDEPELSDTDTIDYLADDRLVESSDE